MGVNNLPKVVAQQCPTGSQTSACKCCYTSYAYNEIIVKKLRNSAKERPIKQQRSFWDQVSYYKH